MERYSFWSHGASVQFSPIAQSCPQGHNTLLPHGLQHTRLLCPPLSSGVSFDSCPLSWSCYLTVLSSIIPFSSCPQSFPASGSFKMSQLENFPKMGKEIVTQVQETQRVPNRINPRRNTPRHILTKLAKIKHKEQLLKAAREKQQITHKGIPIRITADLSIETLQARREWQDTLRVMKENNLQPRLLYPARISFRYEGQFRSFTDKQKLREFSTTKPALQQMLKDLL